MLLATELIPNCDHAGISMVHRNRTIDTPAATDELVRRGDELQYALDEGPCLDAIWHYDTVISANLAEEERWTTGRPVWPQNSAFAACCACDCSPAQSWSAA